jgi:hypothetical protein
VAVLVPFLQAPPAFATAGGDGVTGVYAVPCNAYLDGITTAHQADPFTLYTVTVSGACLNAVWPNGGIWTWDCGYSLEDQSPTTAIWGPVSSVRGLFFDNSHPNCGSYNPSHVYVFTMYGTGSWIFLRCKDNDPYLTGTYLDPGLKSWQYEYYEDNAGAMTVKFDPPI